MALDAREAEMFWLSIDAIEAQNALVQLTTNDFPHLKKQDRSKVHRRLYKLAYPIGQRERALTPEEFIKGLSRG